MTEAHDLVEEELEGLTLLRPTDPDGIFLRALETRTSKLTYWTQLWPAARALVEALPDELAGVRVVEVGCGLGLPSLVAAARGADVTAFDWAPGAVELLRRNAARNGLALTARQADWNSFSGWFDLVLAADVIYEEPDIESLLRVLPRLGGEVLLADSLPVGWADFAAVFLQRAAFTWEVEQAGERVWRLATRRA